MEWARQPSSISPDQRAVAAVQRPWSPNGSDARLLGCQTARMKVHLVDGTYELFRHFFGQPPRAADDGSEIGAARGVILTIVGMLSDGATHLGVATDHVIESFRNDLWPGYKTGSGIDPV